MLQYLIILLDEASVPYCHCLNPIPSPKGEAHLIPLDTLRAGIVFAMKENLNIQFVYPMRPLPDEYEAAIESMLVLTDWKTAKADELKGATCILHTSRTELQKHMAKVQELLSRVARLNVMLTDIEDFKDEDADAYSQMLDALSDCLIEQFRLGRMVQLNLLTDRLLLTEMNNCGAGDTNVTLAPNGKFYLCPAFFHEDANQSVGDLTTGLNIKNKQLLRLDHAPICRHCDAYQCRRCIWMNGRLTLDANTPSHQQCVIAHLERNASRSLMQKMQAEGIRMRDAKPIDEINYLDPFNNYKQWK